MSTTVSTFEHIYMVYIGFAAPTPTGAAGKAAANVRRAGTIVRSPLEARKDRREQADGDMRASDVRFTQSCS